MKPVKLVLFILGAISIFCGLSCRRSVEPGTVANEEASFGIVPLKVGNYWEYKTYASREDSSTGLEIGRASWKVTRTSLDPSHVNQGPLFHRVFINPYDNSRSEFEWLYRNYTDGLYQMGGTMPSDSTYTKILLYRYPVQKGETWKSPYLVYDLQQRKYLIPDTIVYTCVDTNAAFETPLGKFSCIVYYHRMIDNEGDAVSKQDIYEYCSKEVGVIGIITLVFDDALQKRFPYSKRVLVATTILDSKN
jgi:hypothetical protein